MLFTIPLSHILKDIEPKATSSKSSSSHQVSEPETTPSAEPDADFIHCEACHLSISRDDECQKCHVTICTFCDPTRVGCLCLRKNDLSSKEDVVMSAEDPVSTTEQDDIMPGATSSKDQRETEPQPAFVFLRLKLKVSRCATSTR